MNKDNEAPARPHDNSGAGREDKIIKTYAEDMARVIESDQGGLVKKIIHEQEEKEAEKRNLSPESRKNKLYMFFGVGFLFLALMTVMFFITKKDTNPVPIERQLTPIIFNDKSFFIETADLSKDEIIESILTEARETKLKNGGLEGIYFTRNKQLIGLRDFLNILKSNLTLPGENLVSNNFLLGLINEGGRPASVDALASKDFFVLIKMRSVADIFDIFRTWENKMLYDLRGFFGVQISPGTNYLFTKNFEDGIVENKNTRILYGKNGEIIIMYVFADDTSLIIANKREAVREVIFRLSSSQLKK